MLNAVDRGAKTSPPHRQVLPAQQFGLLHSRAGTRPCVRGQGSGGFVFTIPDSAYRPYVAVSVALPSALALSMKPTIAPLAFSSSGSVSTPSAQTVN